MNIHLKTAIKGKNSLYRRFKLNRQNIFFWVLNLEVASLTNFYKNKLYSVIPWISLELKENVRQYQYSSWVAELQRRLLNNTVKDLTLNAP